MTEDAGYLESLNLTRTEDSLQSELSYEAASPSQARNVLRSFCADVIQRHNSKLNRASATSREIPMGFTANVTQ